MSFVKSLSRTTVCFIDLGKLNLLKISLPWSKSMKQTVTQCVDLKLVLSAPLMHIKEEVSNAMCCFAFCILSFQNKNLLNLCCIRIDFTWIYRSVPYLLNICFEICNKTKFIENEKKWNCPSTLNSYVLNDYQLYLGKAFETHLRLEANSLFY